MFADAHLSSYATAAAVLKNYHTRINGQLLAVWFRCNFFPQPNSPCESPTNENSNGLIRDYFPKGTDFSLVTKKELKRVQDELNERPRKVLDMCTPKEVFQQFIMDKI